MAWRLPGFDPLGHLGSGPTGVVIKARDWTSGTPVAIKYLSKRVSGAAGFADTFREDAAVLVRIDSPHVAQVFGYVEEAQGTAVVTEFIDGVSLRTILDNGGRLDGQSALYVMKGALTGLAEAHRLGITHRDLKPANLLIDKAGVTKVVDFGVAVRYRRNAPAVGDPHYIAPELWVGRPASPASDVFAAAAVLFEALTGAPPAAADGGYLGNAGLSTPDDAVLALLANMPERIRALIGRGLSAQPSSRFEGADSMVDSVDLAGMAAYGNDWEATGKARLLARMVPLLSRRPSGSGSTRRALGAIGRVAASANKAVVVGGVAAIVVIAAAGYAVASGRFNQASPPSDPPVVATISHTPVPQIGPVVPTLSPSPGPHPDTTKPSQPTALDVIGRSQTAISLDWDASHDNVKVIGYKVTRDGRDVGTTYTPGFTDTGLTANTGYTYTVTAFDAAGNLSPASTAVTTVTLKVPDTSPPTVPTGLHSTGQTMTTIVLAWNPSHDNVGVAGYDVFRDGTKIASVTRSGFTDTGLKALTTYTYSVRAFDTTYNASRNSGSVSVKTLAVKDTTAPTVPSGLASSAATTSSVVLSWNASTDNTGGSGVVGYNVYEDGVEVQTLASSPTTVTGLDASTTYSFTVAAVDAATNQSAQSSPVSGTTLDNPPTPQVSAVTISVVESSCTAEVSATITTVGAVNSVGLSYTIDGTNHTTSVPITGTLTPVDLGSAADDGSDNGSANVTIDSADPSSALTSPVSDSHTWNADPSCLPPPPPLVPTGVTITHSAVTDAPDCSTSLTVSVTATGSDGTVKVDLTGPGSPQSEVDVPVSGGTGSVTISGVDGTVSGDVTATVETDGSLHDETTWDPGSGC